MGKRRRCGRQPSMWVSSSDRAAQRGPSVLRTPESCSRRGGLRRQICVEQQSRQVLCRRGRSAEPGAGPLLPDAAARLLRGAGLGTGDCVAGRRFTEPAAVPRRVARRGAAGPLDGVAHAASDRRRDAPGGLHLGAAAAGRRGAWSGARRSASTRRRWKPMRRFAASYAGIRARVTRRFCANWRRLRASPRRRAPSWPAWTASARRRGPTTTGRIPRTRTRRSRR